MTVNGIEVKRRYKPARIISDVVSLLITAAVVFMTVTFFPEYRFAVNTNPNVNELVMKYREGLATRQYIAWIFPALAAAVFAAYLILTLKSCKFAKYNITKQNAQNVYDWYAFAVSLVKIPLLLIVFDYMYIVQQRLMFKNASLFNVQIVLYALVTVIIIRLSIHRIRGLSKTEKPPETERGGVKARLADDEDNKE